MTVRKAATHWGGDLINGRGATTLVSSTAAMFRVTWAARAESPRELTSPEELIAAAHSSCFSMALAHGLTQNGASPQDIHTTAEVTFEPGRGITHIHLTVSATVPGVTPHDLVKAAEETKNTCPVSQALSGVPVTLTVNHPVTSA
ncbi:OsmC family peroxiredoxin [Streptomyces klenkii]|uniref:OsmC family peroxiredoxin n=1 Tax=Streptomyces klenkii TaxID=1420899 RepID=UPI003442A331